MELSKELKTCRDLGHIGPLSVGNMNLTCSHCGSLLAGSLPITVSDLVDELASPKVLMDE